MTLARRAVLALVEDELAVVHAELEARLHEHGIVLDGQLWRFDPHILSEAVRGLLDLGLLAVETHKAKGGREVALYVPADTARRMTYIKQRVRRKSMLNARYLTLAGTAGAAGEVVVRASLAAAAERQVPYLPAPGSSVPFGEVRTLLDTHLYGPLDAAAFLQQIPAAGLPQRPVAVPIEVKNRRLVLYPIHKEVHQLLAKAAAVQVAVDYPILPVLVCRRAHVRLFWMARELGFRVHETRQQHVQASKDIDERKIEELRRELMLQDLTVVTSKQPPLIRQFFETTFPQAAADASSRWATTAPMVLPFAEQLRRDAVTPAERQQLVRELHAQVDATLTWAFSDPDEDDEIRVQADLTVPAAGNEPD